MRSPEPLLNPTNDHKVYSASVKPTKLWSELNKSVKKGSDQSVRFFDDSIAQKI